MYVGGLYLYATMEHTTDADDGPRKVPTLESKTADDGRTVVWEDEVDGAQWLATDTTERLDEMA